MMLKVLIVEDDVISAKLLSKILFNLGHCVVGVVKNAEKAILAVQEVKPDLVFMDIDLDGAMNGIITADILTGYYSLDIVFVSIHADYTTRGRALGNGIGYIVKPFTSENIEQVLKSLEPKTQLKSSAAFDAESKKIQVKVDDQYIFINLYDVYFFEAVNHHVKIYLKNCEYLTRGKLQNFYISDTKQRFISPHRSFLVNCDFIESLNKNGKDGYFIILKDSKTKVPVSRIKVSEIKNQLARIYDK